jgi:glycosyltransferase involved in cell wall biosynthesis
MFALDPRPKALAQPAAVPAGGRAVAVRPAPPAPAPVRPANLPGAPQSELDVRGGLPAILLREGILSHADLMRALVLHRQHGGRLEDLLLAHGLVAAEVLYGVLGRLWKVPVVDLSAQPPDPRLIDRVGAAACLRLGMVPWRMMGSRTVVVAAHPAEFAAMLLQAGGRLGPVTMALAPAAEIEGAVLAARGARLAHAAMRRVPAEQSCRGWDRSRTVAAVLAVVMLAAIGLLVEPMAVFGVVLGWAMLTMVAGSLLKLAALLQRTAAPAAGAPVRAPPADAGPLPVVSVMVALYREADVAGRLVRRLERLDYPRDLLDVVLVVEQTDGLTRDVLAAAALPPWMRVVAVPDGPVRTKPRALNYAMDLCRGSIIGVYDAEDAPEPGQIRKVVQHFRAAGPEVACLQGALDFYNPRANWMSRCFALEYAGWFRVVLPGLARMGLPVPLGGTTLFFRRDVLERLGGWDAHNVTEDADLGMRLARQGFVTELVDTVTHEEACCHPWPWVKQRSRWIKGYMMTLAVHLRHPLRLWRELGSRGFAGFLVLFVATLSQFLLAPALWLCWLVPSGVVALPFPAALFPAFLALCLMAEAVNLAVVWAGRRRAGLSLSPLWVLAQYGYFPLATAAAYKALWELMYRPFFWDKTAHGQGSAAAEGAVPQRVRNSPASTRRRVS